MNTKNNKNTGNFKKFLLLWLGELISATGSGLTSFGLGVYIFATTGSAMNMSLVMLMSFLPTLLLSVPAGVLADRYDRRTLMMVGDGFSALGILYILTCMLMGEADIWQICLGVFVSSTFSVLLEPSFRATITDLLTPEEYSKASGLVSTASSARYLISPILAAGLLAIGNIELLLVIDILTFFPTVIAAYVVRKDIAVKKRNPEEQTGMMESLKEGCQLVHNNKGLLSLIMISSVMTCFMGSFQTLASPVILSFTDSTTLGVGETICACGMLVSSLYLGVRGLKRNYVSALSLSLMLAGLFMIGFGLWQNIYTIVGFGFLFFAMLPFANNCLDVLVRISVPDALQGRIWGLIGFLSQIGYVVAYAFSGMLADSIASVLHISVGRGSAAVVLISGILLCGCAAFLYLQRSVRNLEQNKEKLCTSAC